MGKEKVKKCLVRGKKGCIIHDKVIKNLLLPEYISASADTGLTAAAAHDIAYLCPECAIPLDILVAAILTSVEILNSNHLILMCDVIYYNSLTFQLNLVYDKAIQ